MNKVHRLQEHRHLVLWEAWRKAGVLQMHPERSHLTLFRCELFRGLKTRGDELAPSSPGMTVELQDCNLPDVLNPRWRMFRDAGGMSIFLQSFAAASVLLITWSAAQNGRTFPEFATSS